MKRFTLALVALAVFGPLLWETFKLAYTFAIVAGN